MDNVREKSLKLMDEHLDSVSNEVLLHNYLKVEGFKGPLVKEFVSELCFSGQNYDIRPEIFDCEGVSKTNLTFDINNNYVIERTSEIRTDGFVVKIMIESVTCDLSVGHSLNDRCYQKFAA